MELFKILGTVAVDGMDSAEKGLTNLGNVATKVGKVMAAGIAAGATAVSVFAKQSLEAYAEYEQLIGGTELMFGEAYDVVARRARNAFETVQMSQNEYLQQVNGFATGLKTALNGNEQDAADLAHKIIQAEADIVAATGNSQEAVQNAFNGIMKSNFTMLDNLQLGITPTKEGFQEVIDKVNAWNKANGEATDYQMDNLADCQSALVDYVKMQGLAGYAANEAAGTISGSLAMTKSAWQNMLTGFADDEANMDELVTDLVWSATTAMEQIIPRITEIFSGISSALEQVMPIIVAELPGILEQLLPGVISGAVALLNGLIASLPTILQILIEQLPFIFTQISAGLVQTFPILLDTVKNLFGQIWDYIAVELLGTEADFESSFGKVQEIFSGLWEAAQYVWETIGQPIWDTIQSCIGNVKYVFEIYMPLIKQFVSQCFKDIGEFWNNNLKPCLDAISNFIKTYLAPVFEAVFKERIMGAVSNAFNFIKSLWNDTLKPVFTGITDFLTGVFTGNWKQAWEGIKSFQKGIINGIINGIEFMINGAINALNGLIEGLNKLVNIAGAALGLSISIPTIPKLNLPRLEEGGILEKGQVGLLEGNGAEAVVPLDQNKAWISAVARDMESAVGGGKQVQELKEAFNDFVEVLPEMLIDAFTSMKFDVNNREFARLVKAVN